MKHLVALVLLIGALVALTACNPIDDINSVVNNFLEQWKDGNKANMIDLMTDEVEYAILMPDDAFSESLATPPATKKVPAEVLVDELLGSPIATSGTFTITSTEEFGKYGIVTCIFTLSADPTVKQEFVFHLKDTHDGWKINFFGIKVS